MDVNLPDGTLVQNVPDGTTQSQLMAKLQASGHQLVDPATSYSQERAQAGERSDYAGNFRAGAEEGLTGLPGLLVNAVNPVPGVERTAAALRGQPLSTQQDLENMTSAGDWVTHKLNQGLGLLGYNPEDVVAYSPGEKIARFAGAGASGALLPLGEAKTAEGALESIAGRVPARMANAPLMTTARRAATGAAAGTVGGGAGEVVPNDMPATKAVVQTIGTVLGGMAAEAPGAMRDALAPTVRRFTQPMAEAGQQQMAADTLRARATNPNALLETLEQQRQNIVPGSQPTTGQLSNDMGMLSLEREQATKNPDLFMQRRAEQNTARRAALTGIQADADPQAVGTFLRDQFQTFDTAAQQHIDALTARAQEQAEGLGGAGHPEQHGAALRDAMQDAEDTVRARERSLWQTVDPDNMIRVDASPTFEAASDIRGNMSRFAAPMEGDERGIFDSIQGSKSLSLGELSDLRSRVSTAARKELISSGNSPAYARLIRLRGAIQNNLADAASNQATEDTAAVARGEMAPGDTIGSKIKGWVNDFYGRRAAESGTASGEGIGTGAPAGPAGLGRTDGTGFSTPGGPGGAEGVEGLPPQPRPINEEDAANLSAATQATKARAGTFGRGPVGQSLAKAGTQDVYKLPEAKVPEKFFHAGPTSFSDIENLRSVIGQQPADTILRDYAASSLRSEAENPDGTLDPRRVAAWQRKYAEPMRAFPDLDQQFSTAGGATDAIADAAAARRTAEQARNSSALGKVVQAQDADGVTRVIGGILNSKSGRADMGQLAQAVANNPEAKQGLRQAVADHIAQNFISNTEAGTSGMGLIKSDAFQTFLAKNRGALVQVFSPDEMRTLDNIGADLRRANRSITAVKLPGGSNSAQDIHGIVANDPNATVLDRALGEAGAAVAGAAVAHGTGMGVGWLGAKVANAFRTAGLQKVDDLVTQAMLDPVLARNLLRRAPARAEAAAAPLAARLRRMGRATMGVAAAQSQPGP